MQRKTPASGKPEQSEPITRRNADNAGRDQGAPTGAQERQGQQGQRSRHSIDRMVNQSSDDSFPASDPPSWSPTTAGSPDADAARDDDESASKE